MIFSCMQPFRKQVETNIYELPCGKCPYCYKRRISNWSFRLMQEERVSLSSFFITLTYDTENIKLTKNGFMNLDKRDVQLFIKRLRKKNGLKLKYYLCGEYGGKTERPHYHILLFNAQIETIQPAWNLGQIHYGMVSEASVGYTLKYMSKISKIPKHQNDDRQKEFALMSKGLGKNYLTKNIINWHLSDLTGHNYCPLKSGHKISMPRYYKNKIYDKQQQGELKAYHTQRIQNEIEEFINLPEKQKIYDARKTSEKAEWRKLGEDQRKRGN